MNLYGSSQAGGVLSVLNPGDSITLFDGTETPAAGLTSLAFMRGQLTPIGGVLATLFQAIFAANPTATLVVQGSNIDSEVDYQTLWTFVPAQTEALGNYVDNYVDQGPWKFYRVKLTAYASGGMPVVTVQR